MKYLSTKLNLSSQITKEIFVDIICQVHHLSQPFYDFTLPFLSLENEQMTILHHVSQSILCFSLKEFYNSYTWVYEYIYQYDEHVLYIHIENNSVMRQENPIDLIDYLMNHHKLKTDKLYPSYDQPNIINNDNKLDFINAFMNQHFPLPIVYLDHDWYQKYHYLFDKIALLLKGMAFVYCSVDKNIDEYIHHKVHISSGSYFFYSVNDIQKIQYHHLDEHEMILFILNRITDYVTKLDYELTLNKVYLHYLEEINKTEKKKEEILLSDLDEEMNSLDYKIKDIVKKIEDLENDIVALEVQNDYLQSSLHYQDSYPLLLKGDESEFYKGEHKDILLYLLEQDIKSAIDDSHEETKIIKDILSFNKKEGIRESYLDEIKKILWPMRKLNESTIEKLKKYGIVIKKGPTHFDCKFFGDSRYLIPPASTPSDVNAFHEIYREIKKYFF